MFATDADAAIAFRIDVLDAEPCGRRRPPDGNVRDPGLMIGDVPITVSVNVADLGPSAPTPPAGAITVALHIDVGNVLAVVTLAEATCAQGPARSA